MTNAITMLWSGEYVDRLDVTKRCAFLREPIEGGMLTPISADQLVALSGFLSSRERHRLVVLATNGYGFYDECGDYDANDISQGADCKPAMWSVQGTNWGRDNIDEGPVGFLMDFRDEGSAQFAKETLARLAGAHASVEYIRGKAESFIVHATPPESANTLRHVRSLFLQEGCSMSAPQQVNGKWILYHRAGLDAPATPIWPLTGEDAHVLFNVWERLSQLPARLSAICAAAQDGALKALPAAHEQGDDFDFADLFPAEESGPPCAFGPGDLRDAERETDNESEGMRP